MCLTKRTEISVVRKPAGTVQMSARRVWAAPSRWSGHALLRPGAQPSRLASRPFGSRSLPRSPLSEELQNN